MANDVREEPTGQLIGGLVSDVKDLVVTHGQRIKGEVGHELDALKSTIKLTGLATSAIVLAGILLAQAIVFGLEAAFGLPLWAGFGSVGGALAIVGYVVLRQRNTGSEIDLVPEQSMAAVSRDAGRIADAIRS